MATSLAEPPPEGVDEHRSSMPVEFAERLWQAEERYRRLVETIPAITYAHDIGMRAFTYVSPQIEPILGYRPAEFTPALWARSMHDDEREAVMAERDRTGDEGVPFSMVYRVRRKDGAWIWVRDESAALHDASGRIDAWLGVMIDITAEQRAEQALRESESRFRSVVDHLPAALYTEDLDPSTFGTTFVSEQIGALTGYGADEWIRDPDLWVKVVHPDDLEAVLEAEQVCVETGAPFDLDVRIVRRDGSVVWVNDHAVLIRDDDDAPQFWLGFFHDVTAKKQAELEVARALELERASVERLQALDEQKDLFLTATSHEMRTPLAAIIGSARTLQHLGADVTEADRRPLVDAIVAKGTMLARLLDDLLDLDRVRHGAMPVRLAPIELHAVMSRALDHSTLAATHEVFADLPRTVIPADRAMVERIAENLLTNVSRYAPQGGKVWVRTGQVAGGFGLVVEDDGPGVPADLHEVLFEPFRQGSNTVPHSPGIGVGLALVARFAELHGGRAWVEDRAGGGASFRVLLAAGTEGSD